MVKVLDVYWYCANPGGQYLGHVIAGLNALKASFKIFPPHFKDKNALENPLVQKVMNVMYGPILSQLADTNQHPTGILLRLLASVIYHFEWIQQMASLLTNHPFNATLLLSKDDLVDDLKLLVTTEPLPVISEATGIPPMLNIKLEMAHETLQILKQQVVDVKQVSYIWTHVFYFMYLLNYII